MTPICVELNKTKAAIWGVIGKSGISKKEEKENTCGYRGACISKDD